VAVALILIAAFAPQSNDGVSDQPMPPLSELQGERFRERSEVRSKIREELQSPRYKRLRTRLKRFDWELNRSDTSKTRSGNPPGWFRRFLRWLFGGGGNKTPTTVPSGSTPSIGFGGFAAFWPVVWVVLGIGLLIIIAIVIKAAAVKNSDANRNRIRVDADTEAIAPTTPPGELPSDEYMHRAMQFAEQGDHRRALRQLVLGGMSWIERAGLIRFRLGLTNRDYVRAVYRRVEQRRQFAGIILDFERVFFGRRDATAENFEECLASYRNAFGEPADAAKIAAERARQREAEVARRREELRRGSASTGTQLAPPLPSSGSATATAQADPTDRSDHLAPEAGDWASEPKDLPAAAPEGTAFEPPPTSTPGEDQ